MKIRSHKELRVWQEAMDAAMEIYAITKTFPAEEKYSLVDQIRKASRSVAANISEAWRKRRYKAAFISKLSDAEGEACETQTWIEFSLRCHYINTETAQRLDERYETIISQIVNMIHDCDHWIIGAAAKSPRPPVSLSPCPPVSLSPRPPVMPSGHTGSTGAHN